MQRTISGLCKTVMSGGRHLLRLIYVESPVQGCRTVASGLRRQIVGPYSQVRDRLIVALMVCRAPVRRVCPALSVRLRLASRFRAHW